MARGRREQAAWTATATGQKRTRISSTYRVLRMLQKATSVALSSRSETALAENGTCCARDERHGVTKSQGARDLLQYYAKSGHDRFLPHPVPFITLPVEATTTPTGSRTKEHIK